MTRTNITLRLPDQLKRAVATAARNNHRSVNSEILAQLEAAFPVGLEITHGHLLPCPCGAGQPDMTMTAADIETHHVSCPCGNAVKDGTEHGAAIKWNALMRARRNAA